MYWGTDIYSADANHILSVMWAGKGDKYLNGPSRSVLASKALAGEDACVAGSSLCILGSAW